MIFLRKATQDVHIRSLYKFGTDKKKFGCVGSCGYVPASVKIFPTLIVCLRFSFYVCCQAQVCDEYFSPYKKYANQKAGQRLLLFLRVKDENKQKILGCLEGLPINIVFVRKTNQGLKLTLKSKNNQFLSINYHLFGPLFVQSLQKWLGNPEYLLPREGSIRKGFGSRFLPG